jgi:hypothetical protein
MAVKQPIETAPKDGSKVKVYWTDSLGQENESVARFRSLESLRKSGGEWDETDAGWWTFVDARLEHGRRRGRVTVPGGAALSGAACSENPLYVFCRPWPLPIPLDRPKRCGPLRRGL